MEQLQCSTHKQQLTLFCTETTCPCRTLCNQCYHLHKTMPIDQLVDLTITKQLISQIQHYKKCLVEQFEKMENELQAVILKNGHLKPPSTLKDFQQYLAKRVDITTQFNEKIINRIKTIMDAIRNPQAAPQKQQDNVNKSIVNIRRQSGPIKQSQPTKQVNEEESKLDQLLAPNEIEGDILVRRLKEQNAGDWPWKMSCDAVFLTVFTPVYDCKLMGFYQPQMYSGKEGKFHHKTLNFVYKVFKKRNLTKDPIYTHKKVLKHSHEQLTDNCYVIRFEKGVKLSQGQEYSLTLQCTSDFCSHYFSVPEPPNPYIQFKMEDLNDHISVKKPEEILQSLCSYRAGLFPVLIIMINEPQE